MTKTRNKLKIMGLVLTMVLLIASLGVFSLTASAAETTESAIDLSTLTGTYVISDSGEYTFEGSGSYGIKVESGNPTIVLNDASITVGEGSSIDVASGSNATIFVLGDNTIGTTNTESWDALCGGIFVAEGGTVNITSNGTDNILRAHGTLAAAIGGKYDYDNNESYNAGSINISNVTVYAYTNNFYAAAIGAAGEGTCGTINITNAVVYAYGAGDKWTSSPGIGNAWSLLDWSDTIPIVIISDSEVHTFRYNPYSDYIGYLGDESGDTYATGSINCGDGGSIKNSTIYCYTGLTATTTDKVIKYGALGGLLKEDGTCEGEHSGGTQTCMGYKCANCANWYGEKNENHDWSGKDGICTNGCGTTHDHAEDDWNNGICTICDTYQPATLVTNENYESFNLKADYVGYYAISNAGQLFWFAQQVNEEGNKEIKGVLTADIELENRPWTPIGATGEDSNNFRGVFDGQNHTIKGLYVEGGRAGLGFFGEVRTGTVKNFTIYGEVVVNTEVDYVGGVIGSICGVNGETDLERNGAIIQNITSYVNLTAKAHGVGMIGGFVGYANHQSLIENCSWYGTFDAGIYRVDSGAGGFIGKIQENTSEVTIRNCAAYGTIKTNYAGDYNNTATIYMGGFLSFSNTGAKTTLENCLFAGKFERGENLTDQAFLGAFGTLRSVNAIKNCYYLGDDSLEAVHSNSDLKPGSDNVEITSVTGAQLLSGEVAYKLGEHFGQILEGENRQSYPVLGGTKVEDSQRFEIYGQQLNIGGDLSMKYYVMGYAPEFNSKGLYMEFSHNGVKTKVYAGEPNADGFYVFILEGINPQCMGDNIYAMLCYNETEVASHGYEKGKEYSVEKNLLNLLEKYKDNVALMTLIKDTLAYGEAASAYKKHQTMSGTSYAENGSDREIPVSEAQLTDVINGYTVRFGTSISIIIEVDPSTFDNAIYVVECNGTELRNFPSPNSPLYKVTNIAATDFDKEWEFVIRESNPMGDVYGTVVISVNDYLYAISQSTDASDEMKALAKALYNYGVSAEIYNHVKTGEGEHYYVDNVCACGKLETIDATAMTADELKAAVADQLAAGETDITVTLKPDASAEMVTAIRRAICDTEGVADGSINLTLKGVTTIPGTTNWDGVAFGPRNAQWDENNVEIVSHEEVTQLASINLPDVTEIGAQAFLDCSNLTSITAPKVQSIGDWSLQSTAITSIDMPLLKEAGYSAFCRTALTEVSLPSLETAGVIVFGHCEQLRTVDLPKLQNLSQQLFTHCTSLVSVSAPAATSMGINVFKGCSELVSITLPGVTELTNEAFAECTKLENITLGSVITSVNVNLFAGEALSSGITLTLHPDQANAEGDLKATAGTNVEWGGFTWKEVKFSATE